MSQSGFMDFCGAEEERAERGGFLQKIYMYLKLSFCCLKVVCAGIYFDLKNLGVLPSYCVSAKVVLPYLKPHKILNEFVETFFRQFFLFAVLLFVMCQETNRIFK